MKENHTDFNLPVSCKFRNVNRLDRFVYRGFAGKRRNKMKEPYIINVNGISCLITANCRAEAKFKAKKMNGVFISDFDLTDFLIYKNIENEKRK